MAAWLGYPHFGQQEASCLSFSLDLGNSRTLLAQDFFYKSYIFYVNLYKILACRKAISQSKPNAVNEKISRSSTGISAYNLPGPRLPFFKAKF
jgi:hypothetical protein